VITPTRTACYVRMLDGSLKEVSEARSLAHLWGWDFTNVKRVVVREEPVEQYHPWMVHTGELPAIEIKSGYPATECAKKIFLNADCLCEGCAPNLWPRYQSHMWSLLERDIARYKKGPQS
tara:strand:+ start:614 stop:973 length:360 start_codon:yes stop_codon:yes gene_type:complete